MNSPDALEPLLAAVPLSVDAKADLVARMCGADRHYHGADHLALLWGRHRRFAAAARLPASADPRVACAIAYHDAVYAAGRVDNEKRSAALWMAASADERCAMGDADRLWVAETIEATRDHVAAGGTLDLRSLDQRLRQWVLDLDLTPLGEKTALFRRNTMLLRKEASGLSPEQWTEALRTYANTLASARKLYRIGILSTMFEAQARKNIAGLLSGLNADASSATTL